MTKPPANSVHPESRAEWRSWLMANHGRTSGVWLVTYKKATGKPRVEYEEAVQEALCFGWVDSKPRKLDEEASLLWFAPRKRGSGWSKLNKRRVGELVASGKMTKAGLDKVSAAKADGSWNALDEVEQLRVPRDLDKALAAMPPARENFLAFPASVRKGILQWIASAQKVDTRAKRVEETARLAQLNRRANQWRGR